MDIEEVIFKLSELHMEFGNLIERLSEVDDGEDIEYYNDLLDDIHWNNVMLSNRFKKMSDKKKFNKKED